MTIRQFLRNIFLNDDTPPIIHGNPISNMLDAIDPQKILAREMLGENPKEIEGNLQKGDHLFVQRLGYTHHDIYIGSSNVIHYNSSIITYITLEEFAKGSKINTKPYHCRYTPEEVVSRALSKIGEYQYDVLFNNCEQFVIWCRNG